MYVFDFNIIIIGVVNNNDAAGREALTGKDLSGEHERFAFGFNYVIIITFSVRLSVAVIMTTDTH